MLLQGKIFGKMFKNADIKKNAKKSKTHKF